MCLIDKLTLSGGTGGREGRGLRGRANLKIEQAWLGHFADIFTARDLG